MLLNGVSLTPPNWLQFILLWKKLENDLNLLPLCVIGVGNVGVEHARNQENCQ